MEDRRPTRDDEFKSDAAKWNELNQEIGDLERTKRDTEYKLQQVKEKQMQVVKKLAGHVGANITRKLAMINNKMVITVEYNSQNSVQPHVRCDPLT